MIRKGRYSQKQDKIYDENIIKYKKIFDDLTETQNSIYPENDDEYTLIKIILLLHNANYAFTIHDIRIIMHRIRKYLKTSGNNSDEISDNFAKVIEILAAYKHTYLRHYFHLFFDITYNKNTVVHKFVDSLFNANYNFDLQFINRMDRESIEYHNENLEKQNFLNHNLIIYFILSLTKTEINNTFFDNMITLIKQNVISLKHIMLIIQTIKFHEETILDKSQLFITCLMDNILQHNSENINIICTNIIKHCFQNKWVLKLFLQHNMFNIILINILCNTKLLHNNLILLIYATQYNYVVNTELLNKLLSMTETCNCNHASFDDNCTNYITDNFKCVKNIKIINCFDYFKCKPNDETFKISLNNGYIYTTTKIIKQNNIILDINTLNECVKSRNIRLINNILCYKIEPTETTLENLVLSSKKPMNKALRRRVRYRRSRKSKKSRTNKNDVVPIKIPISNMMNIVNLLIKNGLKINLNCVSLLLSVHEHLDNLENYDIPYDENLYFECYINNYFPNSYMDKFTINKNILTARSYSKQKNPTYKQFIEFIKNNDISLDYYMLEDSYEIDDKLTEIHKCVPSILTMYKKTNVRHTSYSLRNFIKLNGITKDMMTQTLKISF